jgi:hypothetical protein
MTIPTIKPYVPEFHAMTISKKLLAMSVFALGGGSAHAQSIEPRAYTNAPIGMNFLIAGYAYTQGGLSVDPSVPLTNANLQTHNTVLAYARSIELGGQSGKFDVIVPYAWLSGNAEYAGQPVERETSGFGAPLLRLSMNFIGAPALSIKEFAGYQQDLIVGGSLQVEVPSGQYDADKLVNIGSNRWFVKPELGVSKAWGPLALELATAATLFGDNEDFFGGHLLEQDPIYSLQGHLVYTFQSGIWAALTGTYFTGGRTIVDGVTENDLQKTTRAGVTLALPVNRHHSIKFYANTGLSIRTGTDFDAIGAAWQYRWGEGF